jgi:glycyl-tRNA synthetase beta chain
MTHTLLLEIGMEECPARFIPDAVKQMAEEAEKILTAARLNPSGIQTFATPRRLAVVVREINEFQDEVTEEIKGPPKQRAYDQQGNPTPAALGFARSQGVMIDELTVKSTEQGEYVYAVRRLAKQSAKDVLPQLLTELVNRLSFPKSMHWGELETRFVRPIRWIVAMLDDEVIPFVYAGVASGNVSHGHRYLSSGEVVISSAYNYLAALTAGKVMADLEKRKQVVSEQIQRSADELGLVIWQDDRLLNEINCMVENPFAVVGSFKEEYLKLPAEVLTTTMKNHQRYFPLLDRKNKLVNRFIGVRDGDNYNVDAVRKGYEKVLQARLADAAFFFQEDKKHTLQERVSKLKNIQFQEKLGSVYDKVQRIVKLTQHIGKELALDDELLNKAVKAASFCKSDLVTHMVTEFPELQGIMGRIYALIEGLDPQIAQAIDEHYAPRYSGAELPVSICGAVVSVVDKIDTLCGCFSVGLIPSGSQDPYALRRQAIGMLQILLRFKWHINLSVLVEYGLKLYKDRVAEATDSKEALSEFIKGRLRGILTDEGYRPDYLDAVLGGEIITVPAVTDKLNALQWAENQGKLPALARIFERVHNLSKTVHGLAVNSELFRQEEEVLLWETFKKVKDQFDQYLIGGDYQKALYALSELESTVDRFFGQVLVMDPDENIKNNRLAMLKCIAETFCQVADLKKIALN